MWSFFSKDPSKDLTNYEIQEPVQLEFELQEKTIWSLNNAKRKGNLVGSAAPPNMASSQQNDSLASVFSYQLKQGNESWLQSAKNCYRRMKMLRHPNVLMFQDGIDSDKNVYIVSERVQHLYSYLKESNENASQKENEISWGLYQIATALSFLNSDCKLVHNNVCLASVLVNKAGEWKLAGFEYTHGLDDHAGHKVLPTLDRYEPPEKSVINNLNQQQQQQQLKSAGISNAVSNESFVDGWMLGCLIWEIFNGILPNANALKNPGNIPKKLIPVFNNLVQAQPNKRLTPSKFIAMCRQPGGFMDNHFVETLLFLEQIQIKDQNEKTKFFSELTNKLDDFPRQLCLFKILPQLLNAYEFGNAGSSVLTPLFKLGRLLEESEYQKKIIPVIVKLFSSTDRTTRMRLLQQLHLFVEHLSATIINDQIFPHLCQGFGDSNPAIREGTIRAIVLVAPKLSYNNLNVELMKYLARLQGADDQGMIRTNTTVCIGKIATYINPQLRQRILLSAFPKAMRDPFPLARLSGIVALANTDRFYTLKDIAGKVIPSLSIACVDPEKDVRDEAFKTLKNFLNKLEKVSEKPEMAIELEKDIGSCNLDLKNETSWTSWAMTSLSSKMNGYKNKNQQPSVALNTQPLAPPTNLLPTNNSTGTANISPNSSNSSFQKEQSNEDSKKAKPDLSSLSLHSNNSSSAASLAATTNAAANNGSGGWTFDDNDWKDLEDDGEMEPLELLEPMKPTNAASNLTSSSEIAKSSKQNQGFNNDWSGWENSFEQDNSKTSSITNKSNQSSSQLKSNVNSSAANSGGLAPASSYNWGSSTKTTKDQEDLFSDLVKGSLPISASASKNANSNNSNKTNAKSEWSDSGWNDVFEEPKEPKQRQRQQNAEIKQQQQQQQQQHEVKQSKPLKLGQRKNQEPPLF